MTVIGVGRDITWFLVSSPAVMRKNAFPDALTQWDGHRPLEEVYCAVTQSRPVAEEYGDQAPSTRPSVLARQLCARERTKTVVCRGARSGTYQPQDGLPWNGTGYVPGSG